MTVLNANTFILAKIQHFLNFFLSATTRIADAISDTRTNKCSDHWRCNPATQSPTKKGFSTRKIFSTSSKRVAGSARRVSATSACEVKRKYARKPPNQRRKEKKEYINE